MPASQDPNLAEIERLKNVLHQAYQNLDALLLYATDYPTDSHVTNARRFMVNLAADIGIKKEPRTALSFPPLTDTYCLPPYPTPSPEIERLGGVGV